MVRREMMDFYNTTNILKFSSDSRMISPFRPNQTRLQLSMPSHQSQAKLSLGNDQICQRLWRDYFAYNYGAGWSGSSWPYRVQLFSRPLFGPEITWSVPGLSLVLPPSLTSKYIFMTFMDVLGMSLNLKYYYHFSNNCMELKSYFISLKF